MGRKMDVGVAYLVRTQEKVKVANEGVLVIANVAMLLGMKGNEHSGGWGNATGGDSMVGQGENQDGLEQHYLQGAQAHMEVFKVLVDWLFNGWTLRCPYIFVRHRVERE